MSKAFTREDDLPERPPARRSAPALPSGAKNYMTPQGAKNLRSELDRLLAGTGSQPSGVEGASQTNELERIRQVQQSLESAVIVGPPSSVEERVKFGASVSVRESGGEEIRYRIVGVDEVDLDRNWVSWVSPVAKALLNAKVGERVRLNLPGREEELEILGISYE